MYGTSTPCVEVLFSYTDEYGCSERGEENGIHQNIKSAFDAGWYFTRSGSKRPDNADLQHHHSKFYDERNDKGRANRIYRYGHTCTLGLLRMYGQCTNDKTAAIASLCINWAQLFCDYVEYNSVVL